MSKKIRKLKNRIDWLERDLEDQEQILYDIQRKIGFVNECDCQDCDCSSDPKSDPKKPGNPIESVDTILKLIKAFGQ